MNCVRNGERVTVVKEGPNGFDLVKTSFGKYGWIRKAYLTANLPTMTHVVRRTDRITETILLNDPDPAANSVCCVRNGERVTVVEEGPNGFDLVKTSVGKYGWIRSIWIRKAYLTANHPPMTAVVQRNDTIGSTALRYAADLAQKGYVPGASVKNGDTVTVLQDAPPHFTLVRTSDGRRGYIRSEYLLKSRRGDMVKKERVLKGGHGTNKYGHPNVTCVKSTKIYVITGGEDGKAVVWERGGAGKIVRTLEGHEGGVSCLDTTPCEKYVVTGSWDCTLILWKLSNGNRERSFVGHTSLVTAVAVTPSGDGIVSGSVYNIAILWNIHDSSRLLTFKGHEGSVRGVVVSSSGLHLFTCSDDTTAIKWSMKTGKRLDTFKGHEDYVLSCCLTSDDKYLLTASKMTTIVWNADDTTRLRAFRKHHYAMRGFINSVCVSSCTPRIVATGATGPIDQSVILWDFQTATRVCKLRDHAGGVNCVHFSKNGTHLLTSSCDNTAIQYDVSKLFKDIPARFALLHCLRTIHEQEANAPCATGTSLRLNASASRAYRTQNASCLRYLMCCVVRDI